MTQSGSTESVDRFSLVAGGPFHATLLRLGLIGDDLLPTQGAVIGLTLLAWLVPALLAVVQTLVDSDYSGWGFFTDLTVYARYMVAIGVMIATERYADRRLESLARQFRATGLITEDGLPGFRAALVSADRWSSSTVAEVAFGAAALVWSGLTARFAVELAGSSWEGTALASGVDWSWAGAAARFVSNPLFLFLVFRWIWRFLLWSALLFRVSRLPLKLTPLHPDRSAGLGFLAIYPSIFGGFVFALSCVVASTMMKDLSLQQHSTQTVWFALGGWLVVCLVLFFGPLVVFSRTLYDVRERAYLEYGCLANQLHLAFHRRWIEEGRDGGELLESGEVSSAADLNAIVETVRGQRIVPVDKLAVVQLLTAAGVPLLAVVATQVPLTELLKWIAGAVF